MQSSEMTTTLHDSQQQYQYDHYQQQQQANKIMLYPGGGGMLSDSCVHDRSRSSGSYSCRHEPQDALQPAVCNFSVLSSSSLGAGAGGGVALTETTSAATACPSTSTMGRAAGGPGAAMDILNTVDTLLQDDDISCIEDFSPLLVGNYYYQQQQQQQLVQPQMEDCTMTSASSSLLLLEPTPMTTVPGCIQVVPQVSLSKDFLSLNKLWNCGDDDANDITCSDVIDVLLQDDDDHQQQQESSSSYSCAASSAAKKRPPATAAIEKSQRQPIAKKPRTAVVVPASLPILSPRPPQQQQQEKESPVFVVSDIQHTSTTSTTTTDGPLLCKEESQDDDDKISSSCDKQRFRSYQTEQWRDRYQDMVEFRNTFGHCCVPNTFPLNPNLAQWVKRQRYQYKLKQEGKHSTLTDEREVILNEMGFIWDSHGAAWMERWNELYEYYKIHGNSNVPTNYAVNRQLAVWVKCQRRQYKLYMSGSKSNMTEERISKMVSLDFVWNPRAAAKEEQQQQQQKGTCSAPSAQQELQVVKSSS